MASRVTSRQETGDRQTDKETYRIALRQTNRQTDSE